MFKTLKILKNQSGIIHLLPLFIVLIGIIAGVYLVSHPQIFKPKASGEVFQWVVPSQTDPNNCISGVSTDGTNIAKATCPKIQFKLNAPAQDKLSSKDSIMSSLANVSLVKTAYAAGSGANYYCKNETANKIYHRECKNDTFFIGFFQTGFCTLGQITNQLGATINDPRNYQGTTEIPEDCGKDQNGNNLVCTPSGTGATCDVSAQQKTADLDSRTRMWFCKDNHIYRRYSENNEIKDAQEKDCSNYTGGCEDFYNSKVAKYDAQCSGGIKTAANPYISDPNTVRWFCQDKKIWREYYINAGQPNKTATVQDNSDCGKLGLDCEEFFNEDLKKYDARCIAETVSTAPVVACKAINCMYSQSLDSGKTVQCYSGHSDDSNCSSTDLSKCLNITGCSYINNCSGTKSTQVTCPGSAPTAAPGARTGGVVPPVVTPPVVNRACPETKDAPYPQCGNTVGLEGLPANLTYMVTAVRDCSKNIVRYEKDNGRDLGQCPPKTAPTNAPVNVKTITAYRYSLNNGSTYTEWSPYSDNMAPISLTILEAGNGIHKIYVQFRYDNGQTAKINGQDFIIGNVDIEPSASAPTQAPAAGSASDAQSGTATLTTSSSVDGSSNIWKPVSINLNLSNFTPKNYSVAGLFIRNQVGECMISNCGYIGWTQIRSYGTSGTDNTSWEAPLGQVSEGVHMFGVFSLNSDGTAGSLLAVSKTQFNATTASALTASCSVLTTNGKGVANVGEQVTFQASVGGGVGKYYYVWVGDISGNTATVTKTYTTVGQKTASVVVADDGGNRAIGPCAYVNVVAPSND